MKVVLFRCDLGGVGHNRIVWPGEALRAQGYDVTVADEAVGEALFMRDVWGETFLYGLMPDMFDADVVVIQVPLRRWRAQLVSMLESAGICVVVELDDDYETISPRNEAWCAAQRDWFTPDEVEHMRIFIRDNPDPKQQQRLRQTDPVEVRRAPSGQVWLRLQGVEKGHHRGWVRYACRHASLVTCTTPAIAERYAPDRSVVLPNCVPAAYLGIGRDPDDHEGVLVGWAGSTATHSDDLQVTGGGVGRAVESTGAQFAVVGEGRGVKRALGLRREPVKSGWRPLRYYPATVAQLDVAIAPLADTAFNRAKSALKMMEMAALGVPVVASPTPDNVRMHREGLGVLAFKPREWEREVSLLVRDNGWRAELAHRGREVMRRWTYEARAEHWWRAWEQALANHRARKVAA